MNREEANELIKKFGGSFFMTWTAICSCGITKTIFSDKEEQTDQVLEVRSSLRERGWLINGENRPVCPDCQKRQDVPLA